MSFRARDVGGVEQALSFGQCGLQNVAIIVSRIMATAKQLASAAVGSHSERGLRDDVSNPKDRCTRRKRVHCYGIKTSISGIKALTKEQVPSLGADQRRRDYGSFVTRSFRSCTSPWISRNDLHQPQDTAAQFPYPKSLVECPK